MAYNPDIRDEEASAHIPSTHEQMNILLQDHPVGDRGCLMTGEHRGYTVEVIDAGGSNKAVTYVKPGNHELEGVRLSLAQVGQIEWCPNTKLKL